MALTPEKTTHVYSLQCVKKLFASELGVSPEALDVTVEGTKVTVNVNHTYRAPTFQGRD